MTTEKQHWQEAIDAHLESSSKPLIAIVGPTASGKTALSFEVVDYLRTKHLSAEILNADSRQFYRGLSIGTAKATEAERARAPHHMIDILSPEEELSAAEYRVQTEEHIERILQSKGIPLLVGGSMLFVSAVTDGLTFAGKVDPAVREALEEEYDLDQGHALYAELLENDPATAERFHKNNKPYVVRAIEILRTTGEKPSAQKQKNPSFDVLMLGVRVDRDILNKRIGERVKKMFVDGWLHEVEGLLGQGVTINSPAMKSLGYCEIAEYLQSENPESLDALIETISSKTRHYAKRQMTWWKGDERIVWVS